MDSVYNMRPFHKCINQVPSSIITGERYEEGRRGGRLEEEDKRQRRVEKTIR